MAGDFYEAGEVAFLLSLERKDATDAPASQLGLTDGGGDGGHRIPTLARWSEVHAARERVRRRQRDAAAAARDDLAAQLRARGWSEQEIADELDASRQTINRRFRATMADILEELGGAAEPEELALSRLPLCLRCGIAPRARAAAVRQRARGGWRTIRPERDLSVCALCAVDVPLVASPAATRDASPRWNATSSNAPTKVAA